MNRHRLCLAGAACCFAAMGITVKTALAVGHDGVFLLGLIRFLAAFLFVSGGAAAGFWRLRVHNRKAFWLRGFFGAGGNFLLFVSIALVGLGRGSVLSQLMVVFAALFGHWLLGERLNRRLGVSVGLTASGVLMLAGFRSPGTGELLAVSGALCSGLALVFIRKLKETDSLHVIFFSQSLCGVLLLLPAALLAPLPTAVAAIVQGGLLAAFFDTCGQYLMTRGMRTASAAEAGVLLVLTPVISMAAGLILFHEKTDMLTLLGCSLILLGSLSVALNSLRPSAQC